MKCHFCKKHVNEKRKTTFYAFVPGKSGQTKKVRWCKPCDESKVNEIDKLFEGGEMTYKQALEAAQKIGASNAVGMPLLALVCQSLAAVHAINPALVFDGAVKQGIDGKALMKLAHADPVALGDLMFV